MITRVASMLTPLLLRDNLARSIRDHEAWQIAIDRGAIMRYQCGAEIDRSLPPAFLGRKSARFCAERATNSLRNQAIKLAAGIFMKTGANDDSKAGRNLRGETKRD